MISSDDFRSVLLDVSKMLRSVNKIDWFGSHACGIELHSGVVVSVFYDEDRIGELLIGVSAAGQSEPAFEIADVLRAVEYPGEDLGRLELVQIFERSELQRWLTLAFSALERYAGAVLSNDPEALESLRLARSQRARTYTAGVNNSQAVSAANEAWRHGDLHQLVDLLMPLQADLSEGDQRRLAFAVRRIGLERR